MRNPARSRSASEKSVARGHEALERGEWRAARAAFEAALKIEEMPQALEGLGLAAWWQDDARVVFDARERAYRLYRDRGDVRGAARVALWLNWDYAAFRGEANVSNGWLERARRLLDEIEPCAETGWVLYREALRALRAERDSEKALRLAREAAQLARTLELHDIEVLAHSLEGLILVSRGEIAAGMKRLDEIATAIAGGDILDRQVIGIAICNLISGCERARDYERAAEWCARLQRLPVRAVAGECAARGAPCCAGGRTGSDCHVG